MGSRTPTFTAVALACVATVAVAMAPGEEGQGGAIEPRAFFAKPVNEQVATFAALDFESQYGLYAYGCQIVRPPATHLVTPFAQQGARVVGRLKDKLASES